MTVHAAHLRPDRKIELGEYALDAVAIEYDDEESKFDFRFELGQGLGIYWALPIERNGRLRLAHVDGAAYTIDEPVLIADPWICDAPRLELARDLKTFADGTKLVAVVVEAKAQPAWYRCVIVVRDARGKEEHRVIRMAGACGRGCPAACPGAARRPGNRCAHRRADPGPCALGRSGSRRAA